jgi:pimeloyl-ACP methyl ester carboxylesterase
MPKPFTRRCLAALRSGAAVLFATLVATADTTVGHTDCGRPAEAIPATVAGRLLILPGVGNTRFHLAGFVESVQHQLPRFDIEVRTWGVPFLTIHNLRAHERNMATAEAIAREITAWRLEHPAEPFYLVGYSGGGGLVTLVTAALPDDVAIDRLVLVAPAISPDYPLAAQVLPHVREFAVNFASERDLQVGWGTRVFGTIDRQHTASAGAAGFELDDERLLQHHWSLDDRAYGHEGNHLSYLGGRWQTAKLLPVLDPNLTAEHIRARWVQTCKES